MMPDSHAALWIYPLQVRRGQRTDQTETKYIELMVVNDHELVRKRPQGVFSYLLFNVGRSVTH